MSVYGTRAETVQGLVQGDHNTVTLNFTTYGAAAAPAPAPPPPPVPVPVPVRMLPPAFALLLDRQEEVERTLGGLAAGLPVELYGAPGSGKTSLIRVLARHPRAHLLPGGVVHWEHRGESVGDLLHLLFSCFYETPGQLRVGDTQLRRYFGQVQALLILDDLELSRPDMETLRNAASGCLLVSASTEVRSYGEGPLVAVGGLLVDDAVALLRQRVGRELVAGEVAAAERVCRALGGNAEAIVQAAGVLTRTGISLDELAGLLAGEAPAVATATVARTLVASLPRSHQAVLGSLAGLGGAPLPIDGRAEALTGEDGAGAILAELEPLGLAKSHSPRYTLAGGAAAAVLEVAGAAPSDRLLDWAAGRAGEGDDRELVLTALDTAMSLGRWALAVRLARSVEERLAAEGRWDTWESVLTKGARAARESGDRSAEARALHQLGTRSLALEQYGGANDLLEQALYIREDLGEHEAASVSRQNLTVVAALMGGAVALLPRDPVDGQGSGGEQGYEPPVREAARLPRVAGPKRPWLPWVLIGVLVAAVVAGVVAVALAGGDDGPGPVVTTVTTSGGSGTTTPTTSGVNPTVNRVSERLARGASRSLTVTGTGFQDKAQVTISGSRVSITVTRVTSTAVVLTAKADSNAATGPRDLTIRNPDGRSVTCKDCVVVTVRPDVREVSPDLLYLESTNKATLSGTGFATGATVTADRPGVAVKVEAVTPTRIDVTVTIPNLAGSPCLVFTVDNGDGGTDKSSCVKTNPSID